MSAIRALLQQLAAPRVVKLGVPSVAAFSSYGKFVAIFSSHAVPDSHLLGTRSIVNLSHCSCCTAILTLCVNPQAFSKIKKKKEK
jgi:hypothetical protein